MAFKFTALSRWILIKIYIEFNVIKVIKSAKERENLYI